MAGGCILPPPPFFLLGRPRKKNMRKDTCCRSAFSFPPSFNQLFKGDKRGDAPLFFFSIKKEKERIEESRGL